MNSYHIEATLTIDAAELKMLKAKLFKKIFPLIENIKKESIYMNVFIYYLQPINISIKLFPVFVNLSESGATNDEIIEITD